MAEETATSHCLQDTPKRMEDLKDEGSCLCSRLGMAYMGTRKLAPNENYNLVGTIGHDELP